jgi:HK97 family phage portal protein
MPGIRPGWTNPYPQETRSGSSVGEDNVLHNDTILACARVLAESVATVPLDLMAYSENLINKAVDDPLYDLIRWCPNPETTSYNLRLWMMIDCITRGRGAAQILYNKKGEIVEIWPLLARRLRAMRTSRSRKMVYLYSQGEPLQPKRKGQAAENETLLEFNEVLCIHFFYHGGLFGPSLVQLQRDHIGSAQASEEYADEYFKNGGVISGTLNVPQELSEAAYERLKADWKANHGKKGERHGVPLLEAGTEFKGLAPNHQESQLLETRKYRRSTLSGVLRVPSHLINDLEKATFSNIEHQDLGFVKHSLRPWFTNWEQSCQLTLLTPRQRRRLYFKHNLRDLLRGDTKSRYESYGLAIQNGIMNPNEAREAEDMNPYEGGDKYLVNGTLRDINNEPDNTLPTKTKK